MKFLFQRVYRMINELQEVEPHFNIPESPQEDLSDAGITLEHYEELSKQVFYIHIYNAIILLKLAEMITFNPKHVFNLNSDSSWLALE